MYNKMTFVKPAAIAKLERIKALLAQKPMTAYELSLALPLSKRWTQEYLNHLHAERWVRIKSWSRKPAAGGSREYPRPVYALMPADAPKPEPYSKTEINKREWKAIKADPERHMQVIAQRRKRHALSRIETIAANSNPFKISA